MTLPSSPRTGFVALQRSLIAALAIAITVSVAQAQLPFQESFEAEPGTSYTLNGAFDDGEFDYFGRFAVPRPVGDNDARDDFANGWDGVYGIQGQDHDGDGGPKTVSVDIAGIDISGSGLGNSLDLSIALTSTSSFESLALDNVRIVDSGGWLTATIAFGALANEAAGFDNYEVEDGDGIAIFAAIDGGTPLEIGRFSPPASGANTMEPKGDLYFDGDGISAALSVDLTDFSLPIPAMPVPAVPEPRGLFLALLSLIGIARIRSRRHR